MNAGTRSEPFGEVTSTKSPNLIGRSTTLQYKNQAKAPTPAPIIACSFAFDIPAPSRYRFAETARVQPKELSPFALLSGNPARVELSCHRRHAPRIYE
jgi:hypothetical protein